MQHHRVLHATGGHFLLSFTLPSLSMNRTLKTAERRTMYIPSLFSTPPFCDHENHGYAHKLRLLQAGSRLWGGSLCNSSAWLTFIVGRIPHMCVQINAGSTMVAACFASTNESCARCNSKIAKNAEDRTFVSMSGGARTHHDFISFGTAKEVMMNLLR